MRRCRREAREDRATSILSRFRALEAWSLRVQGLGFRGLVFRDLGVYEADDPGETDAGILRGLGLRVQGLGHVRVWGFEC